MAQGQEVEFHEIEIQLFQEVEFLIEIQFVHEIEFLIEIQFVHEIEFFCKIDQEIELALEALRELG
jgi:hypothetical protein